MNRRKIHVLHRTTDLHSRVRSEFPTRGLCDVGPQGILQTDTQADSRGEHEEDGSLESMLTIPPFQKSESFPGNCRIVSETGDFTVHEAYSEHEEEIAAKDGVYQASVIKVKATTSEGCKVKIIRQRPSKAQTV